MLRKLLLNLKSYSNSDPDKIQYKQGQTEEQTTPKEGDRDSAKGQTVSPGWYLRV